MMPIVRTIPARRTFKSGWTLVGKALGRDYYTIISPTGEPCGIHYTRTSALAAIRKRHCA